jgi:phosphoserine aminotransferase
MNRLFNFSAGPAMLPAEVISTIQSELLDYKGTGVSIMEMGHRTPIFDEIVDRTESNIKQLLDIPDNYHVLFMHGGASHQFAAIPLNLLEQGDSADYLVTGTWSEKAGAEAKRLRPEVNVINAESLIEGKRGVTKLSELNLNPNAKYLYYTPNETIGGLAFESIPNVAIPVVADYTSAILSEPVDVSKFGLIFAGAQKNLGIAGISLIIIRDDLLKDLNSDLPILWHYKSMNAERGLYNTPATFAWYVARLMTDWMLEKGGMSYFAKKNGDNAARLYQYIDQSQFYSNDVQIESRSKLNIPFLLSDESKNDLFLKQAESNGLVALKGHRSVGGMRASMYNAMPKDAVEKLISFMDTFANNNLS